MTPRAHWAADLVLGVRLAVGGGRTAWARLALTAVGVGLGVVVLLIGTSIGPAREAKSERVGAALPRPAPVAQDAALRTRGVVVSWQGRLITGLELAAVSPAATPPPGVGRVPAPGEIVVSPALFDLLGADEGVRARFPERVIGVIADEGLARPRSLSFYAGLAAHHVGGAEPVAGFGVERPPPVWGPFYQLLVIAGLVAMLLPLGTFVLVSTRLGAAGRDRRLSSIRLVGASGAQVRRIAAGEALVGALLGLLVGTALFFAARPLVRFVEVEGIGFFPTDVLPAPLPSLVVALGVPLVAVGAAVLGVGVGTTGPLGLGARAEAPPRRVGWRLGPLGAGALVLVVLSVAATFTEVVDSPALAGAAGGGIALVLAGTGALLPWLVDRVARRARPDGVAGLLAVRALGSDRNTPRVLSGVVVVLAGGLMLQVLLGVAADHVAAGSSAGGEPGRWVLGLAPGTPVRELAESVSLVGGARRISEVRMASTEGAQVVTTDCAEIADRLRVTDCAPGRAYLVGGAPPAAGTEVLLRVFGGEPVRWVVPEHRVLGGDVTGEYLGLVVADDPALLALEPQRLVVRGDPDETFGERLQAVTERVDRASALVTGYEAGRVELFTTLRNGVLGGSVLLTLLAVVGLVVVAVDRVWERRGPVAVLAANGVPREVLVRAALWQAAIPAALGLAVAAPLGLAGAWLVVPADRFRVDWAALVTAFGSAGAVVLVVGACTLPALRSAITPEGLRAE
ncbi:MULTISPECIES: FtsX-like permease family protein [Actinosynnema]|uniref:FtsX-like permease family protein n=1 Tax=Actinosynnema TaxID=40566 RepID=UPI0020A55D92|nr:FtsX-like permease family protein [Actinosynnema pretiosum]MCP2093818.1 FtsX-like permease family protein [Actinosynnema pretiosum]